MFKKISLAGLLAIFLGFLQNANFTVFFGIKPNFSLAFLGALVFFLYEPAYYFLIVLISVWFLRFEPGLDFEIMVFALIASLFFLVRNYLPWKSFFGSVFIIGLGTAVFYAIADFNFFISNISIVFAEMLYNIALGALFFSIFSKLFKDEKKLRFKF